MFDQISGKLYKSLNAVSSSKQITEAHINQVIKEVKISLLEADVNYRVTNGFLKHVKARAMGREVMGSLSPGQQFIKIIHSELTKLLGDDEPGINSIKNGMTVLMFVGLQGSGKTTSCGKVANFLKEKQSAKPYLAPMDVYRPAAIDQLNILAESIDVPSFKTDPNEKVLKSAKMAFEEAKRLECSHFIIDTAGRLQIDEKMMAELQDLDKHFQPQETLLVIDAMTGQEALNVAKTFSEKINLTGMILSKTDGDARAGAALSIKAITEKPVKFLGTGEKISDFEVFHPDRMASKILGMGDVLSLIEKVEDVMDPNDAKALEEKIRQNAFTLDDFKNQIQQIRKMGPLGDLLKMIPGVGANLPQNFAVDDKMFNKITSIIDSMTKAERNNAVTITSSRRARIAKGSGTSIQDVARLIKQFVQMKGMMQKFTSGKGKAAAMKNMKKMMSNLPGGGQSGMFG